jgi:hypothetical protein
MWIFLKTEGLLPNGYEYINSILPRLYLPKSFCAGKVIFGKIFRMVSGGRRFFDYFLKRFKNIYSRNSLAGVALATKGGVLKKIIA